MIKIAAGFLCILSVCSCVCYKGDRTEFGLPRKMIKPYNPAMSGSNTLKIDTLCVYKCIIAFQYSPSANRYLYFQEVDEQSYDYTSYLKFYSGGKLGLFVLPKSEAAHLSRQHFNPKRAKMGYYTTNSLTLETKIVTDGHCSLLTSKSKGELRNDTLILRKNNNHGHIYIRTDVPYAFLSWRPDW